MLKNMLNYWKSIGFVALITYLSFAPPSEFKVVPPIKIAYFDKFVHVVLYAILTIILIVDFNKAKKTAKQKLQFVLQCLLFPVIMGGCIEIAQDRWFYPRTAEWIDWFSDIIGMLIGVYLMYKLKKIDLTS